LVSSARAQATAPHGEMFLYCFGLGVCRQLAAVVAAAAAASPASPAPAAAAGAEKPKPAVAAAKPQLAVPAAAAAKPASPMARRKAEHAAAGGSSPGAARRDSSGGRAVDAAKLAAAKAAAAKLAPAQSSRLAPPPAAAVAPAAAAAPPVAAAPAAPAAAAAAAAGSEDDAAPRARTATVGWNPNATVTDKCVVCNKTVYLAEKLVADERIFHKVGRPRGCGPGPFRRRAAHSLFRLGPGRRVSAARSATRPARWAVSPRSRARSFASRTLSSSSSSRATTTKVWVSPAAARAFILIRPAGPGFGAEQHKHKWDRPGSVSDA
jgi:hypothetical protein